MDLEDELLINVTVKVYANYDHFTSDDVKDRIVTYNYIIRYLDDLGKPIRNVTNEPDPQDPEAPNVITHHPIPGNNWISVTGYDYNTSQDGPLEMGGWHPGNILIILADTPGIPTASICNPQVTLQNVKNLDENND